MCGDHSPAVPAAPRTGDHPRVCGDHPALIDWCVLIAGSPPRVRGPRPTDLGWLLGVGITPACAGTTSAGGTAPTPRADHPRVCGDHATAGPQKYGWPGSPPRVRGPRELPSVPLRGRRITPACGGDHLFGISPYASASGSPPRVRGPPRRDRRERGLAGITPACAGTTLSLIRRTRPATDHPRVCGDHTVDSDAGQPSIGSPPRVRGPLLGQLVAADVVGITPACAGTTTTSAWPASGAGDHPRVCGDHLSGYDLFLANLGSPPRVRGPLTSPFFGPSGRGITPACAGTTEPRARVGACARITPACAGTTPRRPGLVGWSTDHPRVCGDHHRAGMTVEARLGSPPRVRGPPFQKGQ